MVILVDSGPSSPTKSQRSWPSQPGTSAAGPEAPRSPYVAHSPGITQPVPPPPAYEPRDDAPLLPGPPQKPPSRGVVARRFCSAFSVAVVIFIALTVLKEALFQRIPRIPYTGPIRPRPEDGSVVSCSDVWSGVAVLRSEHPTNATMIPGFPVFSASNSYTLPLNTSLHYIVARGSLSSGLVTILGDESSDRSSIGVHVEARYHTRHALSRARVCELKKTEGGVGIGVYTPTTLVEIGESEEDQIYFIVTVTIPISASSVLDLNGFATNTQNYRHKIENLGDRVHFQHISLKGSNGAIQADQLFVSQGTINTSSGKITGRFNATDSLTLQTSNGLIDSEIGITNDDTHKASDLILETSNGPISASISLLTTHDRRPQPKGGHFKVRATTSNGRLSVAYPSTPVNSLLDFRGKTSNGAADVSLHAAYEGTFRISTSSGRAELDKEPVLDPSGRGRKRYADPTKKTSTLIEGDIYWGNERDRDSETGEVVVKTSNGPAVLRLT